MQFPLPDFVFSNTVTLTTYVYPQDAEGGADPEVASTRTGVPCSVQSTQGRGSIEQARDGSIITHKVYFKSDPGITKATLITWGTKLLSVKDIYDPMTGQSEEYRADCTERN